MTLNVRRGRESCSWIASDRDKFSCSSFIRNKSNFYHQNDVAWLVLLRKQICLSARVYFALIILFDGILWFRNSALHFYIRQHNKFRTNFLSEFRCQSRLSCRVC